MDEKKESIMLGEIQEEEYEIDIANLKKIYSLGKGAFGEVSVFLDVKNNIKYA
jgi:hypothetical protein